MVLNYTLPCLQQLLLDIGVFQFIQYCPSSSPICSSGGENGFEKSPWGLDKLPPSLSDLLRSLAPPLSHTLWQMAVYQSEHQIKTQTNAHNNRESLSLFISIWLRSCWFDFLEGTFFVLPMNTSMRFPGLVGGVFLLWSITSVVLIVRCADTHLCEQFKWHNANNPCHFGNRNCTEQ